MSKNFKKYGAMFITGMLVATMSMTAWATVTPGESGAAEEPAAGEATYAKPIPKKVTTDPANRTMAPKTAFELEVVPGPDDTTVNLMGNDNQTHTYYLTPGTEEQIAGMRITAADFSQITAYAEDYTANFGISVPDSLYAVPGVYSYTVTEKNGGYAGITYDTGTYYMYVSVINGTNGVKVDSVVLANEDGEKIAEITNDYGKTNDKTHDLTITKAITGNAGELSKNFTFVIEVTPDQANEEFELYKGTGNDAELLTTLKAGAYSYTYDQMTNGTDLHIYGLTAGDEIKVSEAQAGADGYTTTYTVTNNENGNKESTALANAQAQASVKAENDGATLTITNYRENVTPTGVAMDIAPYALMLVLAGGAAVTFFRKRQYFED